MTYKWLYLGFVLGGLLVFAIDAVGLTIGDESIVSAPVCKTQESAIAAAQVDAEGGPLAFVKFINDNDDCNFLTFKVRIGKSVFKTHTERGTTRVLEVKAEMEDGSWQTFYLLTDRPIKLSGLTI